MDGNSDLEIVLAQRLASGEPTIRRRALRLLHSYAREQSTGNALTGDSLSRLAKGLHCALWMQDKALLQEELAENICDLINIFLVEEQAIDFVKSLLRVISHEWPTIDRWRMDKFLMLIRRLFRTMFTKLRKGGWEVALVDRYMRLVSDINEDRGMCESLKFHCASVYLDEMDSAGAGELTSEQVIMLLHPYVQTLSTNISDRLFETICTEVFRTILHEFSEHIAANDEEYMGATEEDSGRIKFDYGKIAVLLFETGSSRSVNSKRRKCLYSLSKKFELAASGKDPFPRPELTPRRLKRRKGKECGVHSASKKAKIGELDDEDV